MKANLISRHVHFSTEDRSPLNINHIEQKEKHTKLYPGDRVFIFDTEKEPWERDIVKHQAAQPN